MTHCLKKRFNVLTRQFLESSAGYVRTEFREPVCEATIELVAEDQSNDDHPRPAGYEARGRAENLTPVLHRLPPD